jgi:hypothetical protein
MHYQPKNEMALRHLFSSDFCENELRISYLGPVLNSSGGVEDSPDCLVVDKRDNRRWRILKCEFKHKNKKPMRKERFINNGNFDIAIVWDIDPPLTKEALLGDLSIQNRCSEVIVLTDYQAFRDLPMYSGNISAEELNGIDKLRQVIIPLKSYATVAAAYIAASLYPRPFKLDKMIKVLEDKYPEVRSTPRRGRANFVTRLRQRKTKKAQLIRPLHGDTYEWNYSAINPEMAIKEIQQISRERFHTDIPSREMIESVRV